MPQPTIQLVCLLLSVSLACREASEERPSLVSEPRLLALQIEPPEAAPGQRVQFRLLAADAAGELSTAQAELSFCRTPKALADNRVASDACALHAERPISSVSASVPADACARFGPNVPAGVRPPDPDASGGYYQPLRVALDDLIAVSGVRLLCPLSNAPLSVTREHRERYQPNRRPELLPLRVTLDAVTQELNAIPRDQELVLQAGWSTASRQQYVVYDRASRTLVERTEVLRLAWYASGGELAREHTDSRTPQPAGGSDNRFRSPAQPGPVHVWLVLRDDRGAQSFASYTLLVR